MFARVVTGMIQHGRVDDATNMYKDRVLPAARVQQGFQSATLLSEPTTGKFVSVTVWDTEANLAAGEARGYFSKALAAIAPFFAGPATTERFEVVAQD